ncbi:hypothetical protein WJX72_007248 [[Myrmecia] bisecta]|uniref:Uncharacterized protein n=1 Tax=[Myrmecia] bisecta TaxID=41462 RepID=A0AAW1PT40_9CHLO
MVRKEEHFVPTSSTTEARVALEKGERWDELSWALERQQNEHSIIIMPLFYGIGVNDLSKQEALLRIYHPDRWQQYAADLKAVGHITRARTELVDGFDKLSVKDIVHHVVDKLQLRPTLAAAHPVAVTEDALHICAGLPLGLERLGDHLHPFRDANAWKGELAYYQATEATPRTLEDIAIASVLRHAGDRLPTTEKHVFVDAATVIEVFKASSDLVCGITYGIWRFLPDAYAVTNSVIAGVVSIICAHSLNFFYPAWQTVHQQPTSV